MVTVHRALLSLSINDNDCAVPAIHIYIYIYPYLLKHHDYKLLAWILAHARPIHRLTISNPEGLPRADP